MSINPSNKPAQPSITCGAELVATWRHYAIPRKAANGSVVDTVTPAAECLAECALTRPSPARLTLASCFAGLPSSKQLFSTVNFVCSGPVGVRVAVLCLLA